MSVAFLSGQGEFMKKTLGIVTVVAIISACSNNSVTESGNSAPTSYKAPSAPVRMPSTTTMSCTPAVYNRLTKQTESYDCAVLQHLADGTTQKDLSRSLRLAAAEVVNSGYLVASK